jgi:hypothetical protein
MLPFDATKKRNPSLFYVHYFQQPTASPRGPLRHYQTKHVNLSPRFLAVPITFFSSFHGHYLGEVAWKVRVDIPCQGEVEGKIL